jgi:hypothetical protein
VDHVVAAAALEHVVARSELDAVVSGLAVALGVVELVLELAAHDRLLRRRRERSDEQQPRREGERSAESAHRSVIEGG